jgi:hypothetical protein
MEWFSYIIALLTAVQLNALKQDMEKADERIKEIGSEDYLPPSNVPLVNKNEV